MLESALKHLKVYRRFFSTYWKARLIYKTDFVLGFTSQLVSLATSLAFITLVFTQVESLQGWSLNEVYFLAGFGGIVLNLHHIFFFALYKLGEDFVISGRMDRFLVRPLNPLFQVYSAWLSDDNLAKLLANIALVVYAAGQLELAVFTPVKIAYGALAVVSGVMIFGAIFLVLGTTAFWTGRSQAVFWLFFNLSDFRKYPYGIYGTAVQIVLVTLVPIAFASFFPATFFLERGQWGLWQAASLVAGPVFYLLAYRFWKFGLSNYSSTGS